MLTRLSITLTVSSCVPAGNDEAAPSACSLLAGPATNHRVSERTSSVIVAADKRAGRSTQAVWPWLTKQIEGEARPGEAGVTDSGLGRGRRNLDRRQAERDRHDPNSNAARPRDNEWRFI